MNDKKKKVILIILLVVIILFTIVSGTLAAWFWNSTDNTNVVFTAEKNFSCAADGGGSFDSTDQPNMLPTTCTDPDKAIQKTITVTPTITKDGLSIYMNLWLDINLLEEGLDSTDNFRYALTDSDEGCDVGTVYSYGSFKGMEAGDKVQILDGDEFVGTTATPREYYLYIWIDDAQRTTETAGKDFSFSLNGECTDNPGNIPNKPVLNDGMIPVTIASDGTVTTVSEDNPNWYNYEEKKWANMVLVNKDATEGVEGSNSREYYQKNMNVEVEQSDILAYYVWIPRYKYRIPYNKCSDIPEEDRNMEDYPECYAPYYMSESDKAKLSSYYNGETWCDEPEFDSDALILVNYALQTGRFYNDGTSIISWINDYNNGIYDSGCTIKPLGTLELMPSNFNGNNTFNGSGNEVSIDIAFETKEALVSLGNAKNTYYTHPAFIFGENIIPGFWVGKFETSPDPTNNCYTTASLANCNNATQNPRIIPNVRSLRYQYIGNQFKTSLNIANGTMDTDGEITFTVDENNIYGLNIDSVKTDSHMMKNSEWGAVAYLSHSKYGINSEVYINNSTNYITGRSGGNIGGSVNTLKNQFSGETTSTVQYNSYGYYTWLGESISYTGVIEDIVDSTLGTKASTTGNVTGIYDMSGSAWEYVMGNFDNTSHTTYFPILPNNKYYDVYLASKFTGSAGYGYEENNTLCTLETCGGHALLETANWYNDYASFVNSGAPWFLRGGVCLSGAGAGVFSSDGGDGGGLSHFSWRSVLVGT